ncbi:hypothetical protein LPJ81_001002, partial [Coemansia sp. IMI 209127]
HLVRMISTTSTHSYAERKPKNMFTMRPPWLKKDDSSTETGTRTSSPESSKIKEFSSSSAHGKPKALSRPRVRELLNLAMISK